MTGFLRALAATLLLLVLPLSARAEVAIQKITSPGGIKAWLVEDHNLAFTALSIRFAGGTSLDPLPRRGAVNLMTATLEEGAGALDAQGFAAARDALAAEFRFGSHLDAVTVRARFLTENRDEALALLRQALTQPRFDADAVERVRGQVLAGLRAGAKDPATIGGDALMARMFENHPYGLPSDGTEETVAALTRDDVLAAWKGALARDRLVVGATGDITAQELGVVLDTLFADLPATGDPLPQKTEARALSGLDITSFPGPQALVYFAAPGIETKDPDYFAAVVLNEILGGDRFGSRLMTALREDRGLTYGVGTDLASYDHGSLISGGFQTGAETAGEAIEVLRAEWQRMAETGADAAELDEAKTFLTGSYPLRFDGNAAIAGILVGMQSLGLPSDYPKWRNDRINAVTAEDVARVAARLLAADRLFIQVVGDGTGLKATE